MKNILTIIMITFCFHGHGQKQVVSAYNANKAGKYADAATYIDEAITVEKAALKEKTVALPRRDLPQHCERHSPCSRISPMRCGRPKTRTSRRVNWILKETMTEKSSPVWALSKQPLPTKASMIIPAKFTIKPREI